MNCFFRGVTLNYLNKSCFKDILKRQYWLLLPFGCVNLSFEGYVSLEVQLATSWQQLSEHSKFHAHFWHL